MTDPTLADAFVDWCSKAIAKRQSELAPYKDGNQQVRRRPAGGDWVDITAEWIAQIEREITSLENTIALHKERRK